MTGIGAACLALLGLLGPTNYLLDQQLAQLSPRQREWLLPATWSAATPVWVSAHDRLDWPRAFYFEGQAQELPTHALPGLRLKRLALHRSFWQTPGSRLKAVGDLGVDQAAALFLAYLTRKWSEDSPARRALLVEGQRQAWAQGIPEAQRQQAVLEVSLEFASHLLSVLHEMSRAEARGVDFCRSPQLPLVSWWTQSFERLDFWAFFVDPRGQESSVALPPGSRGALAQTLFGRPWRGDPAELPRCGAAGSASNPP